MAENFVLKGNICYSQDSRTLICVEQGYLVCADANQPACTKNFRRCMQAFL